MGRAAHQTVFSVVACNSDSEIYWQHPLDSRETVVVRTQRHRLDADKFPMFLVGRGKDFVAI